MAWPGAPATSSAVPLTRYSSGSTFARNGFCCSSGIKLLGSCCSTLKKPGKCCSMSSSSVLELESFSLAFSATAGNFLFFALLPPPALDFLVFFLLPCKMIAHLHFSMFSTFMSSPLRTRCWLSVREAEEALGDKAPAGSLTSVAGGRTFFEKSISSVYLVSLKTKDRITQWDPRVSYMLLLKNEPLF